MYDFYIPDALPQLNIKTYTISVEVNKYKTIRFLSCVCNFKFKFKFVQIIDKNGFRSDQNIWQFPYLRTYLYQGGRGSGSKSSDRSAGAKITSRLRKTSNLPPKSSLSSRRNVRLIDPPGLFAYFVRLVYPVMKQKEEFDTTME